RASGQQARVTATNETVSRPLFARLLEPVDEPPLRVHPAEYVPNDAVLAGRVERLQYDQKGLAAVRVKQVLQRVHAFDMGLDLGQGLLMGLVLTGVGRIDFRQPNLRSGLDQKLLSIIHPGCSHSDDAGTPRDWFPMCMLFACPVVR